MTAVLDRLDRPAADVDTYVIESVQQLRQLGIDPVDFGQRHSLLLLKPDAIVARAVEPTLHWLAGNGYRVDRAERITADRHLARAMWRRSWIGASVERRRLADLLVGVCDALVLLVSRPGDDGRRSVPERLTADKGATDPRGRGPGDLRYALGIDSHLLNLVHTPDDPFDVLRELSIVFDESTRRRVLTSPSGDGARRARELAGDLYAQVPALSFDRTRAQQRILADLSAAQVDPPVSTGDRDTDAQNLLRLVFDGAVSADRWSVIVLGSYVLPLSAPNPLSGNTSGAVVAAPRTGGPHDAQ
ncbi:hypothetical protein GCM10027289_21150 [Tsukamurella serpentis]